MNTDGIGQTHNLDDAYGSGGRPAGHPDDGNHPGDVADVNRVAAGEPVPARGDGEPPAKPADPELGENAQNANRDDIVARFKAKREAERAEINTGLPQTNLPDYVTPAPGVDDAQAPQAETRTAEPGAPSGDWQNPFKAPAQVKSTAPTDEPPMPPEAPPGSLSLKIRGKWHYATPEHVATLVKALDPNADLASMSKEELRSMAQRSFVAQYPSEAQRQAQQPPQAPQQPSQQVAVVPGKTLDDLRRDALEKGRYGSDEEAHEAQLAYESARFHAEQALLRQQAWDQNAQDSITRDVQAWGAANPDLTVAGSPQADLFLISASREMANDLLSHGMDRNVLTAALNNPEKMTGYYQEARKHGLQVRSNPEILAAATQRVRQVFGSTEPQARLAPPQAVAPNRREAKRELQAQPQRSGNPVPQAVEQLTDAERRSRTIAKIAAARTANNTAEYV